MKKLLTILLTCITITAAAQAPTLSAYSATGQTQIKAYVKYAADSTANAVRNEYKAAILNQATDSSKVGTLVSRIKAIELFNKLSALYPDTSISITGNKFGVSAAYLTAVKTTISELQQSLSDLGDLVGTNNAEFLKLKARIDTLKLIFTIQ